MPRRDRCLPRCIRTAVALATALCAAQPSALALAATPAVSASRTADYIIAVVNQEVVTASELEQRVTRVRQNAERAGARLPAESDLRRQVLDALIDERVIITHARDSGQRVDENELDRAVGNVALQNQVTMAQLRERLASEGIDYTRFRSNLRDQILIERVREREVQSRIRVTDAEIDGLLDKQRARAGATVQYNIAQILVTVPEGSGEAVVAERRARLEAALARVKAGESFEAVAREVSEDANKAQGGTMGLRPSDRLPDVFVTAVRSLQPGDVSPSVLRTGAGFHALKLVERQDSGPFSVTQTRARHILLRPSAQLSQDAATRRLVELKGLITTRSRSFEQLARDNSEDGSAPQGGDLGWASPGQFVPEFEQAMDALPIGGVSDPVVSRFGVHLIQVEGRREAEVSGDRERDYARSVIREKKVQAAYEDWLRELRDSAHVEYRVNRQQ